MYAKCSACGELRRKYRNDVARLGCGPVQLGISRLVRIRKKLRHLIEISELPVVVFSQWVLGRDPRTAQRYLAGGNIPDSAAAWIDRLEHVRLEGRVLVLELHWLPRNPRWKWRAKRDRIRYQSGPCL